MLSAHRWVIPVPLLKLGGSGRDVLFLASERIYTSELNEQEQAHHRIHINRVILKFFFQSSIVPTIDSNYHWRLQARLRGPTL